MMEAYTVEQDYYQAVEAAQAEMCRTRGLHYRSALEGYGDVSRMLLALQKDQKELKKAIGDLVDWVSCEDADALIRSLHNAVNKASLLAYQAIGMVAMLKRFEKTVKDGVGGDLLDMIGLDEGGEDDD